MIDTPLCVLFYIMGILLCALLGSLGLEVIEVPSTNRNKARFILICISWPLTLPGALCWLMYKLVKTALAKE